MDRGKKSGRQGIGTRQSDELTYNLHLCLLLFAQLGAFILLIAAPLAAIYWDAVPQAWSDHYTVYSNKVIEQDQDMAAALRDMVVRATVSLLLVGAAYKFLRATLKAPKGTSLNPLPPELRTLLPNKEILVRPSSASAQPAELLRAATETMEEKPEELLRAERRLLL